MINVNGSTVLIILIQISTYSAAGLRLKNVLELPCDQAILLWVVIRSKRKH